MTAESQQGAAVPCSWEADLEGLLARITGYLDEGGSGYDSLGREYTELRELWEAMGLLPGTQEEEEDDEEDEEEEDEGQEEAQQQRRQQQQHAQEQQQQQERQGQQPWYSQAFDYWEEEGNCPATEDGVLGGFGHVSPRDIAGSRAFVDKLRAALPSLKLGRVVDCGAGIGRVTKHLLLPLFEKVDMLEQSPRLLAAAPAYLSGGASAGEAEVGARVSYLCGGMQDFDPPAVVPGPGGGGCYDVVWVQWCVGHLHDLDLLRFLRRCRRALAGTGCVVVKDNCCADCDFVLDKEDSSVTRSPAYLKALFRIAGYDLRLEQRQHDFPPELLPVHMFAFTPRPY